MSMQVLSFIYVPIENLNAAFAAVLVLLTSRPARLRGMDSFIEKVGTRSRMYPRDRPKLL